MAGLSQTFRRASTGSARHRHSAAHRAGVVVAAVERNTPGHSTGELSPGEHSEAGPSMKNHQEFCVTLIEILIAVSLLSLLSVGMLVAMRLGFSTMDKTDTRLVRNRRVSNTRGIIESEIEGFIYSMANYRPQPDVVRTLPF